MNFKDKLIFKIALAVILVVSTITVLFSAGQLINTITRDYILGTDDCRYEYPPEKPMTMMNPVEPVEVCTKNSNETKRDLAGSLSILIVSLPIAILSYRKLRKIEA